MSDWVTTKDGEVRRRQRAHHRSPADLFTRGWDVRMEFLACFLLTCPWRTTEGLFWLPKSVMAAELQWTDDDLAGPFSRLADCGFVMYDDRLQIVFLCEALTIQSTANPNQRVHGIRRLRTLQPTPLFDALLAVAKDYDPKLARELLREMPERFAEPSDESLPQHSVTSGTSTTSGTSGTSEPRR